MIKYLDKDQNFQDGNTVYWFDVDGESYGVCESAEAPKLLDCDGYPCNLSDTWAIEIMSKLVVTDRMRSD